MRNSEKTGVIVGVESVVHYGLNLIYFLKEIRVPLGAIRCVQNGPNNSDNLTDEERGKKALVIAKLLKDGCLAILSFFT
ncbi:hypothetical protein B6A27_12120 [Anoxybacillus sp. UARK-01]|jgi:hypothetical protein|nr:hypothetical protein [Anoxybacillus sp. UARK-01]OQM44796.1 hypothetical protein B6A27_12120 [Anoxybacillus sp. UARK-01]